MTIKTELPRPPCLICGSPASPKRKSKLGFQLWRNLCETHRREKYGICLRRPKEIWWNYSYKKHKKASCEFCGFIPVHRCQLDVDHIDGNHENNDVTNLQTLCANCHRLKTWQQNKGGKYSALKP